MSAQAYKVRTGTPVKASMHLISVEVQRSHIVRALSVGRKTKVEGSAIELPSTLPAGARCVRGERGLVGGSLTSTTIRSLHPIRDACENKGGSYPSNTLLRER
jgi:hypothetical protein